MTNLMSNTREGRRVRKSERASEERWLTISRRKISRIEAEHKRLIVEESQSLSSGGTGIPFLRL